MPRSFVRVLRRGIRPLEGQHMKAYAVLALAVLAAPAAAADLEKALPFIADDYPRALAEARAQKLPLFIEAWAPW
jgi:hypothetical protein